MALEGAVRGDVAVAGGQLDLAGGEVADLDGAGVGVEADGGQVADQGAVQLDRARVLGLEINCLIIVV